MEQILDVSDILWEGMRVDKSSEAQKGRGGGERSGRFDEMKGFHRVERVSIG